MDLNSSPLKGITSLSLPVAVAAITPLHKARRVTSEGLTDRKLRQGEPHKRFRWLQKTCKGLETQHAKQPSPGAGGAYCACVPGMAAAPALSIGCSHVFTVLLQNESAARPVPVQQPPVRHPQRITLLCSTFSLQSTGRYVTQHIPKH